MIGNETIRLCASNYVRGLLTLVNHLNKQADDIKKKQQKHIVDMFRCRLCRQYNFDEGTAQTADTHNLIYRKFDTQNILFLHQKKKKNLTTI